MHQEVIEVSQEATRDVQGAAAGASCLDFRVPGASRAGSKQVCPWSHFSCQCEVLLCCLEQVHTTILLFHAGAALVGHCIGCYTTFLKMEEWLFNLWPAQVKTYVAKLCHAVSLGLLLVTLCRVYIEQ